MATLSLARQNEIDTQIESISRSTGLAYPQNGLLDIAAALGVRVVEMDLEPNVNGAVQYKDEHGEDAPLIILNKNYSPERKLFTLAHELGHFVLHKNEERFRLDKVDYSIADNLKETEANYFAASLLVPKSLLLPILKSADTLDAALLAKHFNVSRRVIENRLKWLATN